MANLVSLSEVGNRLEKWRIVGGVVEKIIYHYDKGDARGNGRRLLYETIRGVDGVERNLRGYKYDANGNIVAKSDRFTVSGDVVQLDPAGEDWQYEYNVQNRLVRVCKNGERMWVVVESQEKRTRYVYRSVMYCMMRMYLQRKDTFTLWDVYW